MAENILVIRGSSDHYKDKIAWPHHMSTTQYRPKKKHNKNMKYLFTVVSGAVLQQLLLSLAMLSLFILENGFFPSAISRVEASEKCKKITDVPIVFPLYQVLI